MKAKGRHRRRPHSHPQSLPLLPLGSLLPRSTRLRQTRPTTCPHLWSRSGRGLSRGRRSASQPGAAGRRGEGRAAPAGAGRGGAVQPAREPGTLRGREPVAGPERRLQRSGAWSQGLSRLRAGAAGRGAAWQRQQRQPPRGKSRGREGRRGEEAEEEKEGEEGRRNKLPEAPRHGLRGRPRAGRAGRVGACPGRDGGDDHRE